MYDKKTADHIFELLTSNYYATSRLTGGINMSDAELDDLKSQVYDCCEDDGYSLPCRVCGQPIKL